VWGGMYHELARELRKNMTDTERLLWSKLRGKSPSKKTRNGANGSNPRDTGCFVSGIMSS
jgi:hypothetical protein